MARTICSAILLSMLACAAGCGPTSSDTPFISEATAAPARPAADYGWRTDMSPTAGDGDVANFE